MKIHSRGVNIDTESFDTTVQLFTSFSFVRLINKTIIQRELGFIKGRGKASGAVNYEPVSVHVCYDGFWGILLCY